MASSNANRSDRIYARAFKDEGKGHAIHRNISAERMRPGTCGYFDHTGSWVKVFQVAEFEDPAESVPQGVGSVIAPLTGAINWMSGWNISQERSTGPAETDPAQQDAVQNTAAPEIRLLPVTRVELDIQKDSEEWGMKTSKQVNLKNFEAAANIAAPNFPIGGRFLATYQSFSREGAMLVTQGAVSSHQADPQPVFETWMDQHLPALLSGDHGALIRKRGVWIVTRTYTAARRAVAVMQNRGATVSFAVDATLQQIARFGPSAEWWKGNVREPGWETHNGPNDVVLFMSGIYWKPRRVSTKFKVKWEQKTKNVLAAGHPYQPVVVEPTVDKGNPREYFCMSPQVVGEVEADPKVPRLDFWNYEDADEDVQDDSEDD